MNLVELLQKAAQAREDAPAMRYKREGDWHAITYSDLRQFVEDLAGGLLARGIQPGDRVAIWSANRPEWAIANHATLHVNATVVPVDATAPPSEALAMLEDARARIAFVDGEEKLEALVDRADKLDALETIVGPAKAHVDDEGSVETMASLYAQGRSFLEEDSDELRDRVRAIEPTDGALLAQTSSSSDTSWSVELTHANLAASVDAIQETFPQEDAVHASQLPFSHAFGYTWGLLWPTACGSTVAFPPEDQDLPGMLQEVQPTVLLAPPRSYARLSARLEQAQRETGPLRRRLTWWAMNVGRRHARHRSRGETVGLGLRVQHGMAKRLVLEDLGDQLGKRFTLPLSIGGPLPSIVEERFAAIGTPLMNVYGTTETSGLASANTEDAYRFESAGRPLPGVRVRTDGEEGTGPLSIQGPNVAHPEDDQEAWVRTGDEGRVDEDEFVHVRGRAEEHWLAPDETRVWLPRVEVRLASRPPIEHAVLADVDGALAALVVPDPQAAPGPSEDADGEEPLARAVEDALGTVNQELPEGGRVEAYALLDEPLSRREGLLSPTGAPRRGEIKERFADQLEARTPL